MDKSPANVGTRQARTESIYQNPWVVTSMSDTLCALAEAFELADYAIQVFEFVARDAELQACCH